jgi:hypothetical protein
MPRIVVLFSLREGVDRAAYEDWARTADIPTVNALGSVASFTVHRSTGLLGSDAAAPYDYIEVLDVTDMDGLFADISTEAMQAISAAFQQFAENPQFIVTEDLG